MEKVLKKYKTVPSHLYVRRNADEELKSIIEDMESPGYVLVARQMGKTNLLFNAERDLKNENRLFTYVDLSNLFESESDCYRNIIDNIMEQNEDIFEKIESEILKTRKDELTPHKEYTRSLRTILNHFKGDIVIILDEVDALRSVEYSDHIFAQIRSTYFQRTPFPEYNRLTYILSGVIDPTDLIKDKNKSPFNIGEKIYLDDFTFEQHRQFIENSGLKVSNEISNEVYAWTNGNARLTFDICAEIEGYILKDKEINKEVIVEIINNKYLTNFDLPPIDHIRELVRTNKVARDTVAQLQKGNYDIGDEMKNKLYLYGIVNSSFSDNPSIKNKIIEKSLSLDWINTLEKQLPVTFSYGFSQYETGDFAGAIQTFNQVLVNSYDKDNKIIESCHFYLGNSYYYLKDYANAVKHLNFDFLNEKHKRPGLSLLGTSMMQVEQDKAVDIFEEFIKDEIHDWAYQNALLTYGVHMLRKNKDRAFELFQKLYDSTFEVENGIEEGLNKLRAWASYYQFLIYNHKDRKEDALKSLRQGQEFANSSDSLYLIFQSYLLEEEDKTKHKLISKIIDQKLKFDKSEENPIGFKEIHLLQYIDLVFDDSDLFEKIVNYAIQSLYEKDMNRLQLIYALTTLNTERRINYLKLIIEESVLTEPLLYMNACRDLAFLYVDDEFKFFTYFNEYFKLFKEESIELTSNDIFVFALSIKKKSNSKNPFKALEYCDVIEKKTNNIQEEELLFEALIIYYWQALLNFDINNKERSIFYSEKTLSLIHESKRNKTSMIDEEGLAGIVNQMNEILLSYKNRVPIISKKKPGRNEKVKVEYLDGKIVEGKYKKLERDIISKRCKII